LKFVESFSIDMTNLFADVTDIEVLVWWKALSLNHNHILPMSQFLERTRNKLNIYTWVSKDIGCSLVAEFELWDVIGDTLGDVFCDPNVLSRPRKVNLRHGADLRILFRCRGRM
jgi:hypothetical protein